MARGDTQQLILLGVAGYVVYRLALSGKLGTGAQQAAFQIRPGGGSGGPTIPTPTGCDASFIPGVRYVAEVPSGLPHVSGPPVKYQVVIDGVIRYESFDRTQAEREYNRLVCGV